MTKAFSAYTVSSLAQSHLLVSGSQIHSPVALNERREKSFFCICCLVSSPNSPCGASLNSCSSGFDLGRPFAEAPCRRRGDITQLSREHTFDSQNGQICSLSLHLRSSFADAACRRKGDITWMSHKYTLLIDKTAEYAPWVRILGALS